jgi:5-methylcytosine-specific restriction endonuclease McrA
MILIKQMKRRCRYCKEVLDLNSNNFYKDKGDKDWNKFRYDCKQCNRKRFKTLKNNYTSLSQKKRILNILGRKCNRCNMESNINGFFDIDHIIPRRRKTLKIPSNTKISELGNLQILCPNCHRLKTIEDNTKD